MRTYFLSALLLGTSAIAETTPRLTIQLTDGSRLLGTPARKRLLVQSETLGKLEVPLDKIRTVTFTASRDDVLITLQNGDKIQSAISDAPVDLATVFGPVTLPWDKITTITVALPGGAASVQDGLIAYYPFRGDVEDHSGQKLHGKLVGADLETVGVRFAGNTASYLLIPRAAALEPSEALSFSAWIKGQPGQAAGNGWGTLLRKADNCRGGFFIRGGGSSNFVLAQENPCAGGRVTNLHFPEFAGNRWQHIAATYSQADGEARIYLDGKLQEKAAVSGRLDHTGDLYIGGANAAGDDGGFRGLVSEVRFYKRALTEGEIEALAAQPPADE
ncbi:MAG: hypothetical protein PCFJNLEI_03733 [Verrucomicrobiae bacterium]|nr:hypothetical protein [Verrucomicrobiae bacterium]